MGANAIRPSCSDVSVSTPSVRGFGITTSNGTVNSGSTTFVSGSQSELIPHQSVAMEVDDEDFGVHVSNPQSRQYPQINGDYGHLPFDEMESCCEPENEEDEREAILSEDDDGDITGEWRHLRTSSCSGSRDLQSSDSSNEEHKNAVKYEVDLHFKFLISSMLPVEKLPVSEEGDPESWLEIITSLSLTIATLLIPHREGRGMEPLKYVKIKCLASGRRSDSTVVKVVVCKKNVAHRRMTSNLEKPRILILGGALEYQRVSDLFSSVDTLLQQMAIAKIDTYHPDILLAEKSLSTYDQEYLLAKDISIVQNIKKPLLERIAHCTGGKIVQSIDQLSSQHFGYCDQFYVKSSLEDHGTTGHDGKKLVKTLMYFEGCPHPQGYTVLLRGANGDELKKAKRLLQWGIHLAYRRALFSPSRADKGASRPLLRSIG